MLRLLALVLLVVAAVTVLTMGNGSQAQPFNQFLHFTGPGGGYIEVPDAPELDPASAVTIEAWVYLSSYDVNGSEGCCPTFVGKNYVDAYWLGHNFGDFYFYAHGGASALGVTDGQIIPLHTWTHIAVTYDGITQRHYLNGILVLEDASKPGPLAATAHALRIGNDAVWDASPDGYIDEVRLWSVVRTEAEIQATMNAPIDAPMTGLVAVWHLDGNGDDAIGGHHGTLVGSAEFVSSVSNTITADPSDVNLLGSGGVGASLDDPGVPIYLVGDDVANNGRRVIIKFGISGLSAIESATLRLTIDASIKDEPASITNIDDVPPLTNPGLGDTVVLHIADYGAPDAADYGAPSIGNDPSVLVPAGSEPGHVITIDVTAAVQQAIAAGSPFVAFRIQSVTETDGDNLVDAWRIASADAVAPGDRPTLIYTVSEPSPTPTSTPTSTPTPTPSPTVTPTATPTPTPTATPTPTPTPGFPIEGQLGPCLAVTNIAYSLDNEDKEWKAFQPGAPSFLQTLTQFVVGGGYLVNTSANCTISSGPNVINLYAGWNLFGWR